MTATRKPPAPLTRRLARWLDRRIGAADFTRSALNKVFPDHWSFMIGELALYCLVILILTGVYLGAIVILTGVMPWNRAGVHEAPFVTVFQTVRIPGAGDLMNFAVLTAALSADPVDVSWLLLHELATCPM